MNPLGTYLKKLSEIRAAGAGVKEIPTLYLLNRLWCCDEASRHRKPRHQLPF